MFVPVCDQIQTLLRQGWSVSVQRIVILSACDSVSVPTTLTKRKLSELCTQPQPQPTKVSKSQSTILSIQTLQTQTQTAEYTLTRIKGGGLALTQEYFCCDPDHHYGLRIYIKPLRRQEQYLMFVFETDRTGALIQGRRIKSRRLPLTSMQSLQTYMTSVLQVVYGLLSTQAQAPMQAKVRLGLEQHGVLLTYVGTHLACNMRRYGAGLGLLSSKKDASAEDVLSLLVKM